MPNTTHLKHFDVCLNEICKGKLNFIMQVAVFLELDSHNWVLQEFCAWSSSHISALPLVRRKAPLLYIRGNDPARVTANVYSHEASSLSSQERVRCRLDVVAKGWVSFGGAKQKVSLHHPRSLLHFNSLHLWDNITGVRGWSLECSAPEHPRPSGKGGIDPHRG